MPMQVSPIMVTTGDLPTVAEPIEPQNNDNLPAASVELNEAEMKNQIWKRASRSCHN